MEDILKSLGNQAPGMVCQVIVILLFLRYLTQRDSVIRDLTHEHLEERKIQRDVLDRNTMAAGINTAALNNMAHALELWTKNKNLHR
jgi:hypothetical protein